MGWFDDSDSDDDGGEALCSKHPANGRPGLLEFNDATPASGASAGGNRANAGAKDTSPQNHSEQEEVDPLDAFMANITTEAEQDVQDSERRADHEADANGGQDLGAAAAAAASGGGGGGKKRARRLDVDNEEEATSHWTDRSAVSASEASGTAEDIGRKRLLSNYNSTTDEQEGGTELSTTCAPRSGEAIKAAASMAATFTRAKEVPDDEQHLDNPNAMSEAHQKHLQHQEIDPLAKVDHRGVQYSSFERKFYEPHNTEQGRMWRKTNEVSCSLNLDPILRFENIGPVSAAAAAAGGYNGTDGREGGVFHPEIMNYLTKCGYQSPTLVQSQTLPVALSGHDCIVTASTGSGKTLSYALPLTVHCIAQEHIQPGVDGPIGLVLTPTRELAAQVYKVCHKLLRTLDGRAICVTGGNRGTYELSRDLRKGCEVVVSTPGRLIDLVRSKATNLRRVTMIVLDEADRMLDMGFEKQVTSVMENVRPDRQTLMFSATFGKRVEKVAREWLVEPARISIGRTGVSSEHVSQHVLVLPSYHSKKQWIMEMTPTLADVGRMIVFVSSRTDCEDLASAMQTSPSIGGKGLVVTSIHGDKHQTDRNAALSAFRKGNVAALVATDVAARGLDVQDIMTVVNFDCAKNLDSHVHRVGRAGRMSAGRGDTEQKKGVAYTLLTAKNADFANTLVEAFVREGRHVGDELLNLARNSKHFNGGGGKRSKRSKAGLGHSGGGKNAVATEGNYYGPAGTRVDETAQGSSRPAKKKSPMGIMR